MGALLLFKEFLIVKFLVSEPEGGSTFLYRFNLTFQTFMKHETKTVTVVDPANNRRIQHKPTIKCSKDRYVYT